jgi:hypothetical protein
MTNLRTRLIALGTLAALGLFGFAACEETANTIDCAKLCGRFDECVSEIDQTDCTDRCEDQADADENVEARMEICEDCTSDGSCADIDSCWDDCPAVTSVVGTQ